MNTVLALVVLGAVSTLAQPQFSRPTYRVLSNSNHFGRPQNSFYRTSSTAPSSGPAYTPIISQTNVRDDKGYSYSYETGDKTVVSERGILKPGPEGDFIVAEGSFSFIGTDGTQYTITYKADENGFQPQGAHIPKPVDPATPSFV